MKRDKSKFEKFFSLKRHFRKIGSDLLTKNISTDFRSIKKEIISEGEVVYTHGSEDNINKHFRDLRYEFSGQSELLYTHAKLIVLIRRESNTKKNYTTFEKLWLEEKKFLLKNLNIRWLISATDTFIDHSKDDCLRSLSLACVCLLNTIKIQESERFVTNLSKLKDDKKKLTQLDNYERFPLFDGTSVFKFGTDDTIRNMRWRIDKLSKINVAGEILIEIFKRVQNLDTVYKRTKSRHTRMKTSWW